MSAPEPRPPQRYSKIIGAPFCPGCNGKLERVRQSGPRWLNDDQFDAVKAGDWYCVSGCPDNGRGKSGCAYYWDHEVILPDRRKRDRRARPLGGAYTPPRGEKKPPATEVTEGVSETGGPPLLEGPSHGGNLAVGAPPREPGEAVEDEMVESRVIDLMAALVEALPKRSAVEQAFREGWQRGAHVLNGGVNEDLAWQASKARQREAALPPSSPQSEPREQEGER